MGKKKESNVLSDWILKRMFPACMLYALVMNMVFMVDTIIGGRFLGADAVAIVAIGLPVISFMLSLMVLIIQGCFFTLLQYMGRGDKKGFQRIYSESLWLAIVLGVLCVFLAVCFAPVFAGFSGGARTGEMVAESAALYIRTTCCMVAFYGIGSLLQVKLRCYGYEADNMLCSAVNVLSNVVISILAVQLLPAPVKIAGLGIGSSAAALMQTILAALCLRRHKISFLPDPVCLRGVASGGRQSKEQKQGILSVGKQSGKQGETSVENVLGKQKQESVWRELLMILRAGVPSASEHILASVVSSINNNLILSLFANGTQLLAITAVVESIHTMVKTPGEGARHISEPLFGICFHSRDVNGLKKTLTGTLKMGLIYCIGWSALFLLLCNPIMDFYQMGANAVLRAGIILIVLSSPLSMLVCTMNGFFECTERLPMAMVFGILPECVFFPVLMAALSKPLGANAIWIGMGMGGGALLLVLYLLFMIKDRKFLVPPERMLMLEEEIATRLPSVDISISADAKEVTTIAEKIQHFFTTQGISEESAYLSALCTEEIAADYIHHKKKESTPFSMMDIKAFCDEEQIEIIVRNFDKPYNPLKFEMDMEDCSKIGIYMMQKKARSINYIYAYHLNIVTVILDK